MCKTHCKPNPRNCKTGVLCRNYMCRWICKGWARSSCAKEIAKQVQEAQVDAWGIAKQKTRVASKRRNCKTCARHAYAGGIPNLVQDAQCTCVVGIAKHVQEGLQKVRVGNSIIGFLIEPIIFCDRKINRSIQSWKRLTRANRSRQSFKKIKDRRERFDLLA